MALHIRSNIVPHSEPMRFTEGGRLFRHVRIYLIADNKTELDKVKSVQYELHPTFRQRYHVATDRANNFEIRIWTYGFFNIKAQVSFIKGALQTVTGFVHW